MKSPVDPIKQLEIIIRSWHKKERIDIRGVIIDFCQRTGQTLHDVFKLNYEIYDALFIEKEIEQVECLSMLLASEASKNTGCQEKYLASFPRTLDLLEMASKENDKPKGDKSALGTNGDTVNKEFLTRSTKIWQLSDIHFGKLNTRGDDPEGLAASLLYTVGMNPEVSPDYILVSGDISSIGSPDEFDQFKVFIGALSRGLWGDLSPHRVFLVPGNHEVFWGEDGKADQLRGFQEHFEAGEYCITPYGIGKTSFSDPHVTVTRYGVGAISSPPFAVVCLEDVGIDLVLLVSSFHSGQIVPEVKNLVESGIDNKDLKEKLLNVLRVDMGGG